MDHDKASDRDGSRNIQNNVASTAAAFVLKQELVKSNDSVAKRSGLLARIPFLRSESDSRAEVQAIKGAGAAIEAATHNRSPNNDSRKTRSRKGSLRKTTLLSLGKTRSDKEKHDLLQHQHDFGLTDGQLFERNVIEKSPEPQSPDSDDYPTPRPSIDYEGSSPERVKVERPESATSEESLLSIKDQPWQENISSTHVHELQQASQRLQSDPTPLADPNRDSYFSSTLSLPRRTSTRARSPLATIPVDPLPPAEPWDYAETEWWGWVILVITWAVFVMGMGSCFEVWSWAWAVGKTPYAPPELSDDDTLPVVGYYPALIILTGVMAWIWVFTAWVGMKYFRHAKIS